MAKTEKKAKEESKGLSRKHMIAIIGLIIIIFAIAYGLTYEYSQNTSGSFLTFKNNFNSAPRVAIFVTAYNGTALTSTVGCATSLVEQLVESPTNHRNSTSIDFLVLNQSSCVYTANGLGNIISNYTYTSVQNCINISKSEPSIFINYSSSNSSIIKPEAVYVSGDAKFLGECGVASELSST